MKWLVILALTWGWVASAQSTPLQRVGFGACNMQLFPQTHFSRIAALKPEVFVWMGDIVYTDFLTPETREREFQRVKNHASYQELLKVAKVIGTWDDHDYGRDGGDVHFPEKEQSKASLMSFLDEPAQSPRRTRPGVYDSYEFGPPGKKVKFIVLDGRYFRDSQATRSNLLGDAQWTWLENELNNDAQLTVLVSGSQVLPFDLIHDGWNVFPAERERLLKLLDRPNQNFLVLSGDIHFPEVSRLTLPSGKVVYEATSSGMTHTTKLENPPNQLRLSPFTAKRNFGRMDLEWSDKALDVKLVLHLVDGSEFFTQPVRYTW